MEDTDFNEVRMIFEEFNKKRKHRAELAEKEFVEWFNRKRKKETENILLIGKNKNITNSIMEHNSTCLEDCKGPMKGEAIDNFGSSRYRFNQVFKEAQISDSLFYDIDLIKYNNDIVKIEMKTNNGKGYGNIKMFDTLGGAGNITLKSYKERISYIQNRYKETINGKFDYLVYLAKNSETRIFSNQYFIDNIDKHKILEKYIINFPIPKRKKMFECEVCGIKFETINYKSIVCTDENCKKIQKSIQSRRTRLRKKIKSSKMLVVYPGRFQPACAHHKEVYDKLVSKFGTVIIITSGKQEGKRSPLNFADKRQRIHETFNIPLGNIFKVNNPYKADEIFEKLKLLIDDIQLVVVLGEKDGDRLLGKYYTEYNDKKKMKVASKKGYVHIVDNIMNGKNRIASATSVRAVMNL